LTGFYHSLALDLGLAVTAGSDYHGANKQTPITWVKRHSPLGLSSLWVLSRAHEDAYKRFSKRKSQRKAKGDR
jgi:hypothetical protein